MRSGGRKRVTHVIGRSRSATVAILATIALDAASLRNASTTPCKLRRLHRRRITHPKILRRTTMSSRKPPDPTTSLSARCRTGWSTRNSMAAQGSDSLAEMFRHVEHSESNTIALVHSASASSLPSGLRDKTQEAS
ncbi:hypothetical protein K504DRAFT_537429, partial [Pleomassaria siparia CBS 279.74]